MKRWLRHQLDPIASAARLVIVLDPHCLLDSRDLQPSGEVAEAADWYTLRRLYEKAGRRGSPESERLIVLVHSDAYAESRDLPFDIGRRAAVVRARVPVAPRFRQIVLDLDDTLSERAVEVLGPPRHGGLDDLVGELWGVHLPDEPDEARELEAVVQLRADPTVPDSLWSALIQRVASPMAEALASTPPDSGPAQTAWDDFVKRGVASPHAITFERIGPRLMPIFHTGLLRPSPKASVDMPSWAAAGLTEIGPAELVHGLLETRPNHQPPGDLAGWVAVAEWWGQLRATMADLGADPAGLREQAWEVWSSLDEAFGQWIRASYGGQLLSSSALPMTVDRIAGFLCGRLRRGDAKRVLLIVLDGLGMSQWAIVQRRSHLRVIEAHACLAMIPTLTPISRQAIFRGALPMYYPGTIEKTDTDGAGWTTFWRDQGIAAKAVRYDLVSGASPEPVPLQEGLTAVGLVIQAIDKMLHGANVFGDAQLAASVGAWLERGFLEGLVADADKAAFEVWVTSDHGNLEITPLGQAQEGLAVETAGLRVRLYPTPDLREGSRLRDGGIAWDTPGLPAGWRYPLFPAGRGAYFSGEIRVTHGGLSLDEVIVPLVRVAP